jgi:hypothetical protein
MCPVCSTDGASEKIGTPSSPTPTWLTVPSRVAVRATTGVCGISIVIVTVLSSEA